MAYYEWKFGDLVNHLGAEKAREKVSMYQTDSQIMYLKNVKESTLLKSFQDACSQDEGHKRVVEILVSFFSDKVDNWQAGIKNTTKPKDLSVLSVLNLIRSEKFRQQTETLRQIKDRKQNKLYKQKYFSYVCFSGTFRKRQDSELIRHSKLICIDLDHLEQPEEVKKIIQDDADPDHFLACFTSPNGNGVKVAFYADDLSADTQYSYYKAFSAYLSELCSLSDQTIDTSCKDVSRACFLPYDKDIVVNEDLISTIEKA